MPAEGTDRATGTLYARVGAARLAELDELLRELHIPSRNAAIKAVWPEILNAIAQKFST